MSDTAHKLIIGDSRKMAEVGDHEVHLIVTSPPYWQLKDYGHPGQIGYHQSYEQYIASLNEVWDECIRVLHPGCRMCINIGDQFARAAYYGRYKVIPIRTEIIRHCEGAGLDYMGAVIWQKLTTTHTTGGASVMGSYPYPRNPILSIDYEFILVFKQLGKAPTVSKEAKEASQMTHEEWVEYTAGHWNFPGVRGGEHLASFPEELPRRLIKMFSFAGETVLDPFVGSGTTMKVAVELGRNSIGYEVCPDLRQTIQTRLSEVGAVCDIVIQEGELCLPLTASGEAEFDRRVNPTDFDFGSNIDGTTDSRERLMQVTRKLAAGDSWEQMGRKQRVDAIIASLVAESGGEASLIRKGVRNALKTMAEFAALVNTD